MPGKQKWLGNDKKLQKTGHAELWSKLPGGIFYEDSDFDVESGPRWPKVTENGPNFL